MSVDSIPAPGSAPSPAATEFVSAPSGAPGTGRHRPLTVDLASVLDEADRASIDGRAATPQPWPSGFTPLDTYLNGGFRPGELILLAGVQGLGKTTMALQMATAALASGVPAMYVSYEHDAVAVLERILVATAGEIAGNEALTMRDLRAVFESPGSGAPLRERLVSRGGAVEALTTLSRDLSRLHVLRARYDTSVADIRAAALEVATRHGKPPMIVVDYLQKVSPGDDGLDRRVAAVEDERMIRIVSTTKDLALEIGAPILAIAASDQQGITTGKRLRTHHLRGAAALAYEADIVLVLNDKYDVVARHHLVYGSADAAKFRAWAVMTVEKNRSGVDKVDMEFRKRFDQSRYERAGRPVNEQLVDERVFVE